MANRLKEKYNSEIKKQLKDEFKLSSDLAVPRLKKIVINIGMGEAKDNKDILDKGVATLSAIAGQKPVITKAKKSISAFKLVAGSPIGIMVTLRGEKMYAFLDKLINAVLPKVRDFRGVSDQAFDGQGNYNLGLKEQTIFPEIDYKMVAGLRGLQITVNTSAHNYDQGKRLLELMGMPFRQQGGNR